MVTEETELFVESEKVINWRCQWLCAAGYNRRNAKKIAARTSIDWRFACNLIKKCKDEDLAMKILF